MKLYELMRLAEKKLQVAISLETLHPAFLGRECLKLAPDQYLHHSAPCRRNKLTDGNSRCASNKQRSIRLARCGRSFGGTCPFGIRDFAQPVMYERELAAVLYFTGAVEFTTELRENARFIARFIGWELELSAQRTIFTPETGFGSTTKDH